MQAKRVKCPTCTKTYAQEGKRYRDHIASCGTDVSRSETKIQSKVKCPHCSKEYPEKRKGV
jgi:endogenous inhibitor of DNA gyrase (YacG/DUF329 family)